MQVTQRKQEPFVYGSLGGAQIFLSIKQLNVTINNDAKKDDKQEEAAPNGISAAAADWNNIKDLADKELLEAFIAQHGSDPVYKMLAEKKLKLLAEAEQKADVGADQIAWEALKGSTDAAALKRFIERYPDSRFRKDAEQQVASLAPAQTLQSSIIKDTPAARDCYLLAGEPQSIQGFAGVYLPKIDAKRALTACAQAVNESPDDGMLVNLLGRAHEADRNYTEAHRNYQRASDLGNLYAMTNLGWLSVYGLDGAVDVEKGRMLFEKAANSGNHAAQASLAFLYRDGYGGVAQDYAKAIEWYTKSANQGNASALGNLGWFYREGVGVTRDYQKSVEYYRKGADAGDLSSVVAMGYAAQNGLGVPQNYDEAKTWYEKGANAGDAYSMASLGFLYDAGFGVKRTMSRHATGTRRRRMPAAPMPWATCRVSMTRVSAPLSIRRNRCAGPWPPSSAAIRARRKNSRRSRTISRSRSVANSRPCCRPVVSSMVRSMAISAPILWRRSTVWLPART